MPRQISRAKAKRFAHRVERNCPANSRYDVNDPKAICCMVATSVAIIMVEGAEDGAAPIFLRCSSANNAARA